MRKKTKKRLLTSLLRRTISTVRVGMKKVSPKKRRVLNDSLDIFQELLKYFLDGKIRISYVLHAVNIVIKIVKAILKYYLCLLGRYRQIIYNYIYVKNGEDY